MINFINGNIFNSHCEAITNTINCYGAMGKCLALQFKQKYPAMFKNYVTEYKNNNIKVGKMWIWENPLNNPKWIVNFPTKDHWKHPSKIEYIIEGLIDLRTVIIKNNINSLALPALGCQNGGLIWEVVKRKIIKFHEYQQFSKNLRKSMKNIIIITIIKYNDNYRKTQNRTYT